jgi:hypothetical protein
MAKYYSLPSVYLGASNDGETLYREFRASYDANQARFNSVNGFLKHLIAFSIANDPSLKKPAKNASQAA